MSIFRDDQEAKTAAAQSAAHAAAVKRAENQGIYGRLLRPDEEEALAAAAAAAQEKAAARAAEIAAGAAETPYERVLSKYERDMAAAASRLLARAEERRLASLADLY